MNAFKACLIALFLLGSSAALAQMNASSSRSEVLRMGQAPTQTFQVRIPENPDLVWDVQVLKDETLKKSGGSPAGLTNRTELISVRDKGNDSLEVTLPQRAGTSSHVNFDLCKKTSCTYPYTLLWFDEPRYSTDGTQCVLARVSNFSDKSRPHYIALVLVSRKP